MTRNSHRSGRVSHAKPDSQWRAYERLPPSVRTALQNSVFNWAAYPLWRDFETGRRTAKDIVAAIGQWDKRQIAKDLKRGLTR